MKKIISNEDKEKTTKRNQLIMGLILILIMIFSSVGFAFSSKLTGNVVEEIEINGVDFSRDANTGYWTFKVNGNEFNTVYSPEEVADIEFVNSKTINDYARKPLYFLGEAGGDFAELYRALSQYTLRVGGACLDDKCEQDYPIKNCSVDNVVIIENIVGEDGEISKLEEGITTDDNCVYIRAKPENLIRYIDAYLFDLLGLR